MAVLMLVIEALETFLGCRNCDIKAEKIVLVLFNL